MTQKRLFNLADNEFQYWKPFEADGKIYHLHHLSAVKQTFTHPNRNETYTLYFTFSHHTFTVKMSSETCEDTQNVYLQKPEDKRVFCPVRYQLSFHLPEIINTLPTQFCYHGGYSRYCVCKLQGDDGKDIFYQVVFRVWKARGKMRFHVESAYPLPARPSKTKKVNFWVICHNLLKNKKLPKPPL